MTVKAIVKTPVQAQFLHSVSVEYEWNDAAPFVVMGNNKPFRLNVVILTYTLDWEQDQGWLSDWEVEISVRGSRIKQDGTPYGPRMGERLNVTTYAKQQLAPMLARLTRENRPKLLPQVEYVHDVARLANE